MKRLSTAQGAKELLSYGEYKRIYAPKPFDKPVVTEEDILERVINEKPETPPVKAEPEKGPECQ